MGERQDSGLSSTRSMNVIEPLVTRSQIEKIVNEECKRLRGTLVDIFFPEDSIDHRRTMWPQQHDYSSIIKRLKLEAQKFNAKSAEDWAFELRLHDNSRARILFFENLDFEVGDPILEYRPYSVKFPSDFKNEIKAKDLFIGRELCGRMSRYPELNGFTSEFHHPFEGTDSIPTAIGFFRDTEKISSSFKKDKNVIVRKSNKIEDGELWYFPLWEVPIVSSRRAITYFMHWSRFLQKERVYEHSATFKTAGAVTFESFRGTRAYGVINNTDFDRTDLGEINYNVKIMRRPWVFFPDGDVILCRMLASDLLEGKREELFYRFKGELQQHGGITSI